MESAASQQSDPETHGMTQLDDLIPLAAAAKRLPGRPHLTALWRWSRLGVLARSGDRVRLEVTRLGKRLYGVLGFGSAWLADFAKRLAEADRTHFEARTDAAARPHRRRRPDARGTEQRLAAAAARLKEAGL